MWVPWNARPPLPRRCPPLLSPRPLELELLGSAELAGVSWTVGFALLVVTEMTGATGAATPLDGGT